MPVDSPSAVLYSPLLSGLTALSKFPWPTHPYSGFLARQDFET